MKIITNAILSFIFCSSIVQKQYLFYNCGNQPDSIPHNRLLKTTQNKKAEDRQFLEDYALLLHLSPMKRESPGLHLRIWLWDFNKKYVIDLTYDSLKKGCVVIKHKFVVKDSIESIKSLSYARPKSGWINLIEKMKVDHLFDMETGNIQYTANKYLTHMAYYDFEISNNGYYHYYKYLEPSYYRYVDNNSKEIFNFLEFLNTQFGVKIYDPPLKLFISHSSKRKAD